jgi:hypothetical protein
MRIHWHWSPGHHKFSPNELVDKHAKIAANKLRPDTDLIHQPNYSASEASNIKWEPLKVTGISNIIPPPERNEDFDIVNHGDNEIRYKVYRKRVYFSSR